MSVRQGHAPEFGARWLRCDLHVHSPFDKQKSFSEDCRGAVQASNRGKPQRLAGIAKRFIQSCRDAADGAGIDIVALTDHNSITGYQRLKPHFDNLAEQARDEGLKMPVVLPGVEISVGGERPLHFLIIFASDTSIEDIKGTIRHIFAEREPFDAENDTPRATGTSVGTFLGRLYSFCRPDTGDRNLKFVLLPAHIANHSGVGRETGTGCMTGAPDIWGEMRGHLREWTVARKDWNGFEAARPFERLPQALQELILRWAIARRGSDWNSLSERKKVQHRKQKHWPLVESSDPKTYEEIGKRYSWLKMEVPDVEGIRMALLDPESRLRRMSDGPPVCNFARLQRINIKGTDFFDDIEIPLNPCLTTLIGGRGTGKSTVVEYLRRAVDRAHRDDFPDGKPSSVSEAVQSILSAKRKRDFGLTKGTLLPDHKITVDIVVGERLYRIRWSQSGLDVVNDSGQPKAQTTPIDVRSLIAPRILSQRQIAQIARDPASQRNELDALIDTDRLRDNENRRRTLVDSLTQLQAARSRVAEQRAKLPSVETELQTINDKIAYLESEGRRDVLARFDAFERELRWLKEMQRETKRLASELEDAAIAIGDPDSHAIVVPNSLLEETWLRSVADRVRDSRRAAANTIRDQARTIVALGDTILAEQEKEWQPGYDQARTEYQRLRQEMTRRGGEFGGHEKLLQRRAQLEREKASLQQADHELRRLRSKVMEVQTQLVATHRQRQEARREIAQALKKMDADVRVDICDFQDRFDFESRREQWFGGAGLYERDWSVLCDYAFGSNTDIPGRIWKLAEAFSKDIELTSKRGAPLDKSESQVALLAGSNYLSKNFYNALARRERIRLADMECFLPEDLVRTQVRTVDGSFKTIETGSVGEKSTAILSLLLSAGTQPIIIDQPEDDLDNQYVYTVIVDLLRRRKFSRQIIIATHNANIPVNGDAELIVALGAKDRRGVVLGAGSIDRSDIKDLVNEIMEGSTEAFRMRQERYGG